MTPVFMPRSEVYVEGNEANARQTNTTAFEAPSPTTWPLVVPRNTFL